jgi:hypothetical protein
MSTAISKAMIEAQLAGRFGDVFKLQDRGFKEIISTGIPELDAISGGLPRGAITEIFGPASSGRTTLMLHTLAHATTQNEVCALVDADDALDPDSASTAAIDLEKLLWIRCGGNLEHSFKATDLVLQGGGFGLVILDLGDVPAKEARRVISSWWYRFRRVVETTPTALVVITQQSCVRSCASLILELRQEGSVWSRVDSPGENVITTNFERRTSIPAKTFVTHANILRTRTLRIERVKPIRPGPARVQLSA